MLANQPFDVIPIWLFYILTILLSILAAEVGYRLGSWWQARHPGEKDSSVGAIVASTLGLTAFLLAFITGIAADRYNARRVLVITDANAIGTTYLRAGYLPEPTRTASRNLLRDYVDDRVRASVTGDLSTVLQQSDEIQAQLWALAEQLARENMGSEMVSLYVSALNDMIDVHSERVAAVTARVPPTMIMLIFAASLFSLFLLGFGNSYNKTRSMVGLIILAILFSTVLLIIVDLDRPMEGLLRVSQQPMLSLQAQMHR